PPQGPVVSGCRGVRTNRAGGYATDAMRSARRPDRLDRTANCPSPTEPQSRRPRPVLGPPASCAAGRLASAKLLIVTPLPPDCPVQPLRCLATSAPLQGVCRCEEGLRRW